MVKATAISTVRTAIIAVVVLVVTASGQQIHPHSPPLAVTHVTIVDVTNGTLLPEGMVTIAGDRIQSVLNGKAAIPRSAHVIDGRHKYLIPGLWDMHTHLSYARSAFPALIANGVTYVRDVGSRLAEIDEWRGEIAAGHLVGPTIVRAGPILNRQERNRYRLAIANAADARATVRAARKSRRHRHGGRGVGRRPDHYRTRSDAV